MMKVTIEQIGSKIIFHLNPNSSDLEYLQTSSVELAGKNTSIDLRGESLENIHPDLIGLSTILMCHPFVGKELELPVMVSEAFFESANKVISKYKISSEPDSSIVPYSPPIRARPALAFSGGADSSAALSVMPGNTIPIFMNRPMKRWSIYDSDAPLANCGKLREIGFDVQIIDCDLEYLRKPVGFPSDLAHAIPSILLANSLGLDSIAFGTVMESAYGIGHERYKDYPSGAHRRFYGSLMDAAGLMLSLPVSGISEVGTSIINDKSPLGDFSQSCIRGKRDEPCLRCWKCFRKRLLSHALFGTKIDIDKMISKNKEVAAKLSAYPISHENVLAYSIQNVEGKDDDFIQRLRNRLDISSDLEFLEYWYSPSINLVPEKYRVTVKQKISKFLPTMTKEHERTFKDWNMEDFLLTDSTKRAQKNLKSLF